MKRIALTNGGYTTVDDKDYEFLSQFEWYGKRSDGSKVIEHAARNVRIGKKTVTIRMHRLITEAHHDQEVIHIDGNGLHNRRRNLQLRTLKPWTGRPSNSGFRGVRQISTNRWAAEIDFAGRTHSLGDHFRDAQSAARAYDLTIVRLYGENAVTNFEAA